MTLIDSDSDEEFEIARQLVLEGEGSSSGGSSKNARRFIRRNRLQAHQNLFCDYFADPPIYPHKYFRRRFRMSRPLFLRIQTAVEAHEPYFVQRRDSSRRLGFSSLQKITAALRMLAYGVAADFMDEYLKIGETIALRSLKMFVKAVVSIFSEEYLRKPNNDDIVRLLAVGEKHGFPESVASYDLWIWHAFFGLPGSHNDINVLDRSFIFSDLAQGRTPTVNYTINGHNYAMGYYLADGIYLQWATFVKTISAPQGNKKKYFAAAQESAQKDVERAFGVLQARFAIIRGPARFFHIETLNEIMMACIILHNMIIEDERAANGEEEFEYEQLPETYNDPVSTSPTPEFSEFIQRHHALRDRRIHSQLQTDLVEHLWQQYSAA
ncbi:uncharacterized protein LOC122296628 [Carya illinoinensis]|uniref:uncharacterized protein LOC122296628 n=1 Tax=Carya illinoinensis TaxID=32201 RepID=UPI001C719CC5|nr:uncharacterized protein LOC122296628 [Carya illinoinensis]